MKRKNNITKYPLSSNPIYLSKEEKRWIKLIKGHYHKIYRTNAKNWIETLQVIFEEIYGWSPKEHYADFLDCIFQKLFEIYMKIRDDKSGHNMQLKEIIRASFQQSFRRDYKEPIERVIAELCGQIQCNTVIEGGFARYDLS